MLALGSGWGGIGVTPGAGPGSGRGSAGDTPGAGPQVWLGWCWHYQALGLAGAVVAGPLRLGWSPLAAAWSCESSLPLVSSGWVVGSGLLSGETASTVVLPRREEPRVRAPPVLRLGCT